jgi:hypothetical protein
LGSTDITVECLNYVSHCLPPQGTLELTVIKNIRQAISPVVAVNLDAFRQGAPQSAQLQVNACAVASLVPMLF